MNNSCIKPVLLFYFLIILLVPAGLSAQQNPFLTTNAPAENREEKEITGGGWYYDSSFMIRIRAKQKMIQTKISANIAEYKNNRNLNTLSTFLGFSFLYGLLHVLGPGHRKIFLFTYFISRPSKWKHGMAAGFLTAVLHAVSAVIIIGGLYFIASRTLASRFNNISPILEKASYGAIVAIGAYLLIISIFNLVKRQIQPQGSTHNPDTLIFILVSGLVPCPGAAAIMIFALSLDVPVIGVYSVLAMSLGMASILTLVPPAAILIKNRIEPLISRWNPATGEILHSAVSAAGAFALILLGLFFII